MKNNIFFTALLAILAFTANAQSDTMYIIKNGIVINKYNIYTDLDSIIFYDPHLPSIKKFVDSRDMREYEYVTIGTQKWMSKNLEYLPQVDSVTIGSEKDQNGKYYYVYGFTPNSSHSEANQVNAAKSTSNYQTYGVLYNWNAALEACPAGWHLPSESEWATLVNYIGGSSYGYKLKETGTSHWAAPNSSATNEVLFNALPAGYRWNQGSFALINTSTLWWSSIEDSQITAIRYYMDSNSSQIITSNFVKHVGFSVRCLKD